MERRAVRRRHQAGRRGGLGVAAAGAGHAWDVGHAGQRSARRRKAHEALPHSGDGVLGGCLGGGGVEPGSGDKGLQRQVRARAHQAAQQPGEGEQRAGDQLQADLACEFVCGREGRARARAGPGMGKSVSKQEGRAA